MDTPRPSPRTNRTRLVPRPGLTGHVSLRYRDGHAEHELTEADLAEHRAEAEREFALFDKDGDGRLTLEEAMELVRGDTEIGVGEAPPLVLSGHAASLTPY